MHMHMHMHMHTHTHAHAREKRKREFTYSCLDASLLTHVLHTHRQKAWFLLERLVLQLSLQKKILVIDGMDKHIRVSAYIYIFCMEAKLYLRISGF